MRTTRVTWALIGWALLLFGGWASRANAQEVPSKDVGSSTYLVPVFPGAQVNLYPTKGTFRYTIPLFKCSGVGPCTTMTLTYDTANFNDTNPGPLGAGWQCSYNMRLGVGTDSATNIKLFLPWNGSPLGLGNSDGSSTFNVTQGFGFSAQIAPAASGTWGMQMTGGMTYLFKSDGSLQSIADPVGNRLDVFGNDSLHPTSIVDMIPPGTAYGTPGVGRTTTIVYYDPGTPNLAGRLSYILDPAGNRYDMVYSPGYSGYQLTSIQLPPVTVDGVSQRPTYNFVYYHDATGLLSQVLPPRAAVNGGYSYGLTYDNRYHIVRIDDPSETYLTDGGSRSTTPTNVQFAYSVQNINGFSFSSSQMVNAVMTDRRGNPTAYVFNSSSMGSGKSFLLSEIWDADALMGAASPGIWPIYTYFDPYYNLLGLQDRYGNVTTYTFTPPTGPLGNWQKNLLEKVQKPGPGSPVVTEQFTYTQDIFSNVLTHTTWTDAGTSRTTTNDYDTFGRITTIHHPDVNTLPNVPAQTSITTSYVYDTVDPRSPLKQIKNEMGNSKTFQTFDSRHSLPMEEVSDGGTQPLEKRYDVMGNLVQTKLPQGQGTNDAPDWINYNLDSHYRVASITETFDNAPVFKIQYGFDLDGHQTSVLKAGDATTPAEAERSTFDKRGFLSGGSGPDGTWTQTVDANGNVREKTSLRTFKTTFTYDILNRKTLSDTFGTSTVGASGGGGPEMKTTYQYDLGGTAGQVGNIYDQETRVSAAARLTKTYYDNRHRVSQVLLPDLQTATRFTYDFQDQLVAKETLFGGAVQKAEVTFRDERDRVFRQRVQKDAYSPTASPSAFSDKVMIRNAAGTVIEERDPLWNSGSPTAHRVQYTVDARERVISTLDGFGVEVKRNTYGDDDKLTQVQVPDPATKSKTLVIHETYRYTPRKELKEVYNRDNVLISQNVYRVREGVIDTTTDAAGVVTQTTYYPNTWHVNEVITALGNSDERRIKSVWTPLGGLLAQTQVWDSTTGTPEGATYSYFYDQADRLELFQYPGGLLAPEQHFYSEFSELSIVQAGSKVCSYIYDALGRLTSSNWTGPVTETFTQSYDALGNVTSLYSTVPPDTTVRKNIATAYATSAWLGTPDSTAYSILGVPWQGSSPTLTYTYDLARHLTALTDKEGGQHAWSYDADNRLSSTGYAPALPVKTAWNVTYTPGGLTSTATLHNASGTAIATTTFTYDGRGRRIRQETVNSTTHAVLSDLKWQYDDRDLVTNICWVHLGVSSTIGYNARREVVSEAITSNGNGATPPPFTNTLVPVILGHESAAVGPATVTTASVLSIAARTATYAVDPAGNRKSQTITAATAITTQFTYNSASQLLTETIKSPTQTDTIAHLYDVWGNEYSRTTDLHTDGIVDTTEQYQYSSLGRLSVYKNSTTGANWQYDFWPDGNRSSKTDNSPNGTNTKEFYILKFGDVIADYQQVGSGTITFKNKYVQGITTDSKQLRIGSDGSRRFYIGDAVGTLGMTLDDTAAVQQTYFKDVFGVQLVGPTTNPERYSGIAQRERDTESGLDYLRARMYDPRVGRFTQTDPILENRPLAHYSYTSNNPVSMIDPMGLQEGPAIEREVDGRKYICECDRNPLGFMFEWMGLSPNVGRNLLTICTCGTTSEQRQRLRDGLGLAMAEGCIESAKKANPGFGMVVLTEEFHSGRTVSTSPQDITSGEAVWSYAKDLSWYAVGSYLGGKAGDAISDARTSLPRTNAHLEPRASEVAAERAGGSPEELVGGQLHEGQRLDALGLEKNNEVWRPKPEDINSAAFKVIVGKPKYTPEGDPVGTIFDSSGNGVLREIKGGSSSLDSSYQLRLQTYYSLKTGRPYIIDTTRPVNPKFEGWLKRWGVTIENTSGAKQD